MKTTNNNYTSLDDFQSIDDFIHKRMTWKLLENIEGVEINFQIHSLYSSVVNKLPYNLIHEIVNLFNYYCDFIIVTL